MKELNFEKKKEILEKTLDIIYEKSLELKAEYKTWSDISPDKVIPKLKCPRGYREILSVSSYGNDLGINFSTIGNLFIYNLNKEYISNLLISKLREDKCIEIAIYMLGDFERTVSALAPSSYSKEDSLKFKEHLVQIAYEFIIKYNLSLTFMTPLLSTFYRKDSKIPIEERLDYMNNTKEKAIIVLNTFKDIINYHEMIIDKKTYNEFYKTNSDFKITVAKRLSKVIAAYELIDNNTNFINETSKYNLSYEDLISKYQLTRADGEKNSTVSGIDNIFLYYKILASYMHIISYLVVNYYNIGNIHCDMDCETFLNLFDDIIMPLKGSIASIDDNSIDEVDFIASTIFLTIKPKTFGEIISNIYDYNVKDKKSVCIKEIEQYVYLIDMLRYNSSIKNLIEMDMNSYAESYTDPYISKIAYIMSNENYNFEGKVSCINYIISKIPSVLNVENRTIDSMLNELVNDYQKLSNELISISF